MKKVQKWMVMGVAAFLLFAGANQASAADATVAPAPTKTPAQVYAELVGIDLDAAIQERQDAEKSYGALANEKGILASFQEAMKEIRMGNFGRRGGVGCMNDGNGYGNGTENRPMDGTGFGAKDNPGAQNGQGQENGQGKGLNRENPGQGKGQNAENPGQGNGYGDGTGSRPQDGTGAGPGDGTQPQPKDGTGFGATKGGRGQGAKDGTGTGRGQGNGGGRGQGAKDGTGAGMRDGSCR